MECTTHPNKCQFMKTNLMVQNPTQPLHLSSLKYHVDGCRCCHVVFKVLSTEDCVAASDSALHCLLPTLAEMESNMASAIIIK